MLENSKYSNINGAKPLLNVAAIFGQYPYCVTEKFRKSTPHVCYGILLVVSFLTGYCCTIMKIIEVYTFEQPTAILDIISKTSTTMLCVTAVSGNTIFNGKQLHNMTGKLKEVDVLLKLPDNRKHMMVYTIQIAASLVLVVGYFTYLTIMWYIRSGFAKISINGLEMILTTWAFITNWLILYYILAIRFRFKCLNACLRDAILLLDKSKKVHLDIQARLWIETYTILTAVIDDFNDIFGAQLFYIFINALLGVLMPINSMILLTSSLPSNDADRVIGIDYSYVLFVMVLFPVSTGIYMAKVADHAYQEEKTTGFLTYKMLHCIPNSSIWAAMRGFRDDLMFLAKETSFRCPQFSAAGFFPVDYSMLFILLTSITTYLVVLIQFNKY